MRVKTRGIILRRALFAIVLIGIPASACFGLLETHLRHRFGAWPFERQFKQTHLKPDEQALRYRPDPADKRSNIALNSLGLRNREIGPKTNQFRILFLGDSLVWDGATTRGILYTQAIEEKLNVSPPTETKTIEVINAGIPGYTTFQEVEFLKVHGFAMAPDLVILGFVNNDLFYKYLHKPLAGGALGYEPEAKLNGFSPYTPVGWIFARSYAAHALVHGCERIARKFSGRPSFPFEDMPDFRLAWKEYAWVREEALLRDLNQLLNARGIRLVVVAFPVVDQVNVRWLKLDRDYVLFPQRKLSSICDRHGIQLLDLTDALHQGGTNLFKDYVHLTPEGNDLVGEQITRFLLSTSIK